MKNRITLLIDLLLFIGWTAIGLLNLLFFFVHVSPKNFSGLFDGQASISFVFMTISAFLLTALSIVTLHMAIHRKALLRRLRSSLIWRFLRIALTAFAAFFVIVVTMIIIASFPRPIPQTDEIIILGAHVAPDGLSATLQSRLDAALEYANANPDIKIIASGGQGLDEPVSEAVAMRDFLVANGVDEKRILLEDNSHNTFENLTNSMEIIHESKERIGAAPYPVTIVTSEYHIFRTAMIARRAGYEPYFIPARTPLSILPSSYSREFFGLIKSYFADRY